MCPLFRIGLEPCWLQCSSHMAEQKTEVEPVFQFTFWKTSLPRNLYTWSTMLLSWGLRWDTLLPQAGKEPKSQAQSTQSRASCWDLVSTFPLLASSLHSSDKQRNNLLLLTQGGCLVKSRKLSEKPQNCGACFCFHLQTMHHAHTLVTLSKISIPQTHWPSFVSLSPGFSPLVPSPSAGAWHFS